MIEKENEKMGGREGGREGGNHNLPEILSQDSKSSVRGTLAKESQGEYLHTAACKSNQRFKALTFFFFFFFQFLMPGSHLQRF